VKIKKFHVYCIKWDKPKKIAARVSDGDFWNNVWKDGIVFLVAVNSFGLCTTGCLPVDLPAIGTISCIRLPLFIHTKLNGDYIAI
jgi:hypothetical protein